MAETCDVDSPAYTVRSRKEQGLSPEQGNEATPPASNSSYHELQVSILNRHHVEIRQKLHYRAIVAHLNQYGLLSHSDYAQINAMPYTMEEQTNFAKIDRLISVLPNCGHKDFLPRFIRCLRESTREAGEAHSELAESLHNALQTDAEDNENFEEDEEETESEATEMTLMVSHGGDGRRTSSSYRPGTGESVSANGQGIVTIIVLSQIPQSTFTFPRKITLASNSFVPLELGIDNKWISSVQLQFDGQGATCSGAVHIIPSRSCDDLPRQVEVLDRLPAYTYLLPGSRINISVDQSQLNKRVFSIWVLSSISAFNTISTLGAVKQPCDLAIAKEKDYNCFIASKYNLSYPIIYDVTSASFFSLFNFRYNFMGIIPNIEAKTYNFTAAVERKLVSADITFSQQSPVVEFEVNHLLQFPGESCILTESNCQSLDPKECTWTILAVKERKDILLFPALLVVIFAAILCILVVVSVYVCVKRQRRRC